MCAVLRPARVKPTCCTRPIWSTRCHAVLLAGGSAWGLDAAAGVMRWLEEHGIGLPVHYGLVPIVPAAVLFDLPVGDYRIRPDAQAGYAACVQASRLRPADGNVGAGAGALVGKLFGISRAMKGGIGSASITLEGVTVGAIVAVNALGDVIDPATGATIAGARTEDGRALLHIRECDPGRCPAQPAAGRHQHDPGRGGHRRGADQGTGPSPGAGRP